MQPQHPIHPPITSQDCQDQGDVPGWASRVRQAISGGQPVRAGSDLSIEACSEHTGLFQSIMLPGGGTQFATAQDRDSVLAQLL